MPVLWNALQTVAHISQVRSVEVKVNPLEVVSPFTWKSGQRRAQVVQIGNNFLRNVLYRLVVSRVRGMRILCLEQVVALQLQLFFVPCHFLDQFLRGLIHGRVLTQGFFDGLFFECHVGINLEKPLLDFEVLVQYIKQFSPVVLESVQTLFSPSQSKGLVDFADDLMGHLLSLVLSFWWTHRDVKCRHVLHWGVTLPQQRPPVSIIVGLRDIVHDARRILVLFVSPNVGEVRNHLDRLVREPIYKVATLVQPLVRCHRELARSNHRPFRLLLSSFGLLSLPSLLGLRPGPRPADGWQKLHILLGDHHI
mmetsp:Transcript_21928/g.58076  ORF Transcript_21928/g.58076 Transcript_21928/m.58076 type:complete len:308 (+) Transcript_21928:313-1236(+)